MCPWYILALWAFLSLNNMEKRGPQRMDTVNEEGGSEHLVEHLCSPGAPKQPSAKSCQHPLEIISRSRSALGRNSHKFPLAHFWTLGIRMKKARWIVRQEQLGISRLCSQLFEKFFWESWSEAINKKEKETLLRGPQKQGYGWRGSAWPQVRGLRVESYYQ